MSQPREAISKYDHDRVAALIAAHKTGEAVDFAKDLHLRVGTADSEALLASAYDARFHALVEHGMLQDALTLAGNARQRCPSLQRRIGEWRAILANRAGEPRDLLELLADPELAPDAVARLHNEIRRGTTDPRKIAACAALAEDHPLRVSANAVWKAFAIVTSGPVADEAVALPEVPRSSPLAPWKMIVRAIAAYHRGDDATCERCVAAVDPASAPARLIPVLRAHRGHPGELSPAARKLTQAVAGERAELRAALMSLESAFGRRHFAMIPREITRAFTLCATAAPHLRERLHQMIMARAIVTDFPIKKAVSAAGGDCRKNSWYWHLTARACEERKQDPMAIFEASARWEEFRMHAVHEGRFPESGPASAAVYLRMAEVLGRIGLPERDHLAAEFEDNFDEFGGEYRGQPVELRRLAEQSEFVFSPEPFDALRRACRADPAAESFQAWMDVAESPESEEGEAEAVAEEWSAARPGDIPPLLYLMKSAESRDTLQKAFKLMERAEKIDAVNAEVRRARFRLMVRIAIKHLRAFKPKLVGKDLAQIEKLQQAQQGDRPALIAALRWVFATLSGDPKASAAAEAEVTRLLGDKAATCLLIDTALDWCGRDSDYLKRTVAERKPPTVVAFGRVFRLGEEAGLEPYLGPDLARTLLTEIRSRKAPIPPESLYAVGEAAIATVEIELAHAASAAGLALGPEHQGRFLFLRARTLGPGEQERRMGCVGAARELARRYHDAVLEESIRKWREASSGWGVDVLRQPPDQAAIDALVANERKARYQKRKLARPGECQCPSCRARRAIFGSAGDPVPEYGGPPPPLGPPPVELPKELRDLVDELGPLEAARVVAEILGLDMGPKRPKRPRKGRSRPGADDDVPF